MTTYAQAVIELVGDKFIGGPTDGPVSRIRFKEGTTPPNEEAIQAKLAELQANYDAKSYARNRQQNYPNEHDLLIALWEKVVEGRSESADALEVKRQEVKTAHPKPE